ncbi:MAG: hypothetical protein AUI10_13290 [Actinobacteria bacterium 13_2_20CM_2_72_6]|nr:MAG: hypothetical protein AUI10_13290 [Actinobacteria bacterium 13_2_20CM_2_72_6]
MTALPETATVDLATRARLEAALLRRRRGRPDAIAVLPRAAGEATFPASHIERLMWYLHHEYPGRSTFLTLGALRLRGELDVALLERAFNGLLVRHDVLRAVYRLDGEHVLRVERSFTAQSIPVVDVREDQVDAAGAAVIDEPFDLTAPPLMRLRLLRRAPDDHVAVLVLHHIVSDGRSMEVFFQELATLYLAWQAGIEQPLAPLPVQYADVVAWQRGRLAGAVRQEQTAYWTARLHGHQLLELPTDARRSPEPSSAGLTTSLRVPDEVADGLRQLGGTHQATLFMVTLAAFDALLAWYSGQRDILVATPVSWRDRPELDALMGAFINYLPLRADLSGDPTFAELLNAVRDHTAQDLAHHELPLDEVIAAAGYQPTHGRAALLRVLFTEEADPSVALPESGELRGELVDPPWHHALRDFTVRITAAEDGTYIIVTYRTDAFTRERVADIAADYLDVLTRVVADPRRRVFEPDGPFGVRLRVPPVPSTSRQGGTS